MRKRSEKTEIKQPRSEVSDLPQVKASERGEGESISAKELAFLAAIISPEECRSGAAGSALRYALALFMESNEVVQSFNSAARNLESLFAFCGDSPGGNRLFEFYSQREEDQIFKPLRLDADESRESDEVRNFLSENCNFEGGKGSKSWGKVRTVWENFEAMYISEANAHNERNKERIIAAEKRTAEIAAANEGKGSLPPRLRYDDEGWQDWKVEFEQFKRGAAKYAPRVNYEPDSTGMFKPAKVSHYEIGRGDLQALIRWKRWIKTKGGIKAVKPRTREDVLGMVKKSNPKKKK